VDSEHVFVVDNDRNLWLETGPFGAQIPPPRVPVDGNVVAIQPIDASSVYVLGTDGNLWLENAPFGTVPLPPCSETHGFGKGFGCRTLIHSNVDAFVAMPGGAVYVVDGNLDLWKVGTPNIKIDGNVIAFQPLTSEQSLMRKDVRPGTEGRANRPVRRTGLLHALRPHRRP
jgi:hypothetical protein